MSEQLGEARCDDRAVDSRAEALTGTEESPRVARYWRRLRFFCALR